MKKTSHKLIDYLNKIEIQAMLDVPNLKTYSCIFDRAILHPFFAGVLRVSELVGLTLNQIVFQPSATIHIISKGRRERVLPIWKETINLLHAWLAKRPDGAAAP